MAYIKTLKDNELIGGTDNTDVYPVSTTQAIFSQKPDGTIPEGIKHQRLEDRLFDGEEEVPAQPQGQEDKLHKSGAQLESSGSQGATQNFNTLAKSRQWRKQVSLTLKQKWPETSKMSMEELKKFLKDKNVEVDAIGTSDTAVLAWIDTIINCR